MIYLIFAIVSSALVSIIMRVSEEHVKHNISMLAMNYVMCIVLGAYYSGADRLFVPGAGFKMAAGLGALNGILYLGGFVLLQMNVRKNGIVLSSTFMKLGVLVPTVVSVLFFKEVPALLQICGFIIAVIAIIVIHFERGQTQLAFKMGLILLLLFGGGGDAMSKVYEELGRAEFEEQFLMYTFLSALVLCIVFIIKERQRLAKSDIFFGLLIGIPNYYSARFLLKALGSVPAVIAYPTYSVGTIVVISAVGIIAFHEQMTRQRAIAIGMILAALVFLNM